MHEANAFLSNLAIVLGVAAITTVVFQRLRQPVIFGYMLAGLVIGPHIPVPLVADPQIVQALAELGVVLLMFSLGLEFTFRRLMHIGPGGALVAILETSFLFWVGFSAARLFGWSMFVSAAAGGMVAISSTTVIVKAFRAQGVRGPVADLVFSVLIFEDMLAILLLALLTPVASGGAVSSGAVLNTMLKLVGFLAGAVTLGLLVLPRAMREVVKLGRAETTVVASVGVCFGGALLAQQLGYSVALGAFLAGALVAESGEAGVIERLVEPIRDLLVAVFFVAVGMMVDPALVMEHWVPIVVFTVLVVVGKIGAVSVSAFFTGRSLQSSLQAGMSMAQIGEFSFIIAGVGLASGASPPALSVIAVAVSALTTLLTPWLIRVAPVAAAAIDGALPRPLQNFVALYGSWVENLSRRPAQPTQAARWRRVTRVLALDAVLLAAILLVALIQADPVARWAAGRFGLALPLARAAVAAVALALGAPFAFGVMRTSATLGRLLAERAFPDPEPGRLDPAAAPRRAMVVTIQLAVVAAVGIVLVAVTQPLLPGPYGVAVFAVLVAALSIRFWRDASNLSGHTRAGAQVIVAALTRQTSAPAESTQDALTRAYRLVPGLGSPVPMKLEDASPAVGKTIGDLELRGRTGATILAIMRGEEVVLVPDGHQRLEPGDVLALAGTEESVAEARRVLGGPSEPAGAREPAGEHSPM